MSKLLLSVAVLLLTSGCAGTPGGAPEKAAGIKNVTLAVGASQDLDRMPAVPTRKEFGTDEKILGRVCKLPDC